MWVAWLATNLGVYRIVLWMEGVRNLNGFFIDYPETFGISVPAAGVVAEAAMVVLIVGSYLALIGFWLPSRRRGSSGRNLDSLKISCSVCGGHIAFPPARTGKNRMSALHGGNHITGVGLTVNKKGNRR